MLQQGLVGTIQTMSNPATSYYIAANGNFNANPIFNTLNVLGNTQLNFLSVTQNIGANNLNILYNCNVAGNTQLNNLNIAGSVIVNQNTQLNNLNVTQNISANNLFITQNMGANNMDILYNFEVSGNTQLNNLNVTGTIIGNFPGQSNNSVLSATPIGNSANQVVSTFLGPFTGNCLCSFNVNLLNYSGIPGSDGLYVSVYNAQDNFDRSSQLISGIINSNVTTLSAYQVQLYFPGMVNTSNYQVVTSAVGNPSFATANLPGTSSISLKITKLS